MYLGSGKGEASSEGSGFAKGGDDNLEGGGGLLKFLL